MCSRGETFMKKVGLEKILMVIELSSTLSSPNEWYSLMVNRVVG